MTSFQNYIDLTVEGADITVAYEPESDGIRIDEVYVNALSDPYTALPYFTDYTVDKLINPGSGCDDELEDLEPVIYGMAMARMERMVFRAIADDEDLVIGEAEQAVIEEGI
jgi:hypothetical protein